ncbi:cupredoxin domain-containing protein [Enterovibrio coralii]|uniref:Copper-binding protein n=1 Tax=Enterovibrio coralii TaxID=294935 RepID=A0A135IAC3_9GAMM|nr:hypothetical protein [Enterovibrio coralii]KXF82334.1 hypothetical protein ATN88_09245 [Enterovibrio coralii]
MDNTFSPLKLIGLMAFLLPALSFAKGDLSQRATELPKLVLGNTPDGYGLSEKQYNIETGKSYVLEIESTGNKECAFEATRFFNNVWVRKIELNGIEVKANGIYELEFEREGEVELYFVPIKPGSYSYECRGLASKGMHGTISIE